MVLYAHLSRSVASATLYKAQAVLKLVFSTNMSSETDEQLYRISHTPFNSF